MEARHIHSSMNDFKVIEVSEDEHGNKTYAPVVIPQDFKLAVSMGLIPGHSSLDKFGENPDIDTGSGPEDIIEWGGEYSWTPKGTSANIDTASSSSALDVGQLVKVIGIIDPDNDNGESLGYFITNGQNKVLIYDNPLLSGTPIKFWRLDRAENESDEGGDLNGEVYIYRDTTITDGVPDDLGQAAARISNGNNQTLQAVYTTRPKKVSFLVRGELGMSRSQTSGAVQAAYYSRRYGKVFKVKKRVDLTNSGSSSYQDERSFPDIIPALTDIRLRVEEVSANNAGVFGTFDILIVDEELFSTEFLTKIGQPGY